MRLSSCFPFFLGLVSLIAGVGPVRAAARTWVGDLSVFWSNPNNWDPVGIPEYGEDLTFAGAGPPLQQIHMVNDLVDLRVRDLFFCGVGWSLDGNELTLLRRVDRARTNSCGEGSFLFNCNLKLGGPTVMEILWGSIILKGNIDLAGNSLGLVSGDQIIVSSSITGTGNVFATIDGYVRESSILFDGPVGNTFSGRLAISQRYDEIGQVIFAKQSGVVVNDALLIDRIESLLSKPAVCRLARSHQIGDHAEVGITGGGQLLLQGNTETIGSLSLTNYSGDTEPSLVDTGGATLSVLSDITAVNDATNVNVVPTIRGLLGLPGPQ
jgi:hypothetical protein